MHFGSTPPPQFRTIEYGLKQMLERIRDRVSSSPHIKPEERSSTLMRVDSELSKLQTEGVPKVTTPESS